LSKSDPQEAASQVALMAAGNAKDRAVPEVVKNLARVDPQAAADFITKQGSEGAQRDSMRELMPVWVSQNSSAALTYATSLPAGSVQDRAYQSYIFANSSAAPADLVEIATAISDDGERTRAIGMTVSRWMREDEAAATTYVNQSTTLSDEAKKRILNGDGWDGGGRGRGRN
jgi:hypothetical protein